MKTFNFLNDWGFNKIRIHLPLPKVKPQLSKMVHSRSSATQELRVRQNQPEEKKVELPRYLLI